MVKPQPARGGGWEGALPLAALPLGKIKLASQNKRQTNTRQSLENYWIKLGDNNGGPPSTVTLRIQELSNHQPNHLTIIVVDQTIESVKNKLSQVVDVRSDGPDSG